MLFVSKIKIIFILIVSLVILSGCVSAPPERMQDFSFEPSFPQNIPERNAPINGSLFHQGNSLSLFDDSRAHRVGDIITVNLIERFDARKKGQAEYNKTNQQRFGLGADLTGNASFFGNDASVPGALGTGLGISYGSDGSFSGHSNVRQNSSIRGTIAVTVVKVIPNGNLVIRGERWITLHEGDQVMRFAGVIRAEDIKPDNSIVSSKVADVRFITKDVGISGDTARPGIITQLLHKYWPL